MRFLKIFFISLALIVSTDLVINLDTTNIKANKKDIIVSKIINDSEWHKLDFKVSFIEAEFQDNQDSIFIETENTLLPIKLSKSSLEGMDEDEYFGNDNKLSIVSSIPSSQWIRLISKGSVKIYGWNEEIGGDVMKPVREMWAGLNAKITGLKIISRNEWGADETLRYDYREGVETKQSVSNVKTVNNGESNSDCAQKITRYPNEFIYSRIEYSDSNGMPLLWPYQYSPKIKKAVVHHTAESDTSADLPGEDKMRSIYRYHTITRGWGDVGYNYVIDQKGNIYEGRSGGDYVVGAHAYCSNIGTVGISLMGNFQNKSPTTNQLSSLAKLTAYVGEKYNFIPSGSSKFHGENTSNILGHRDLKSTACPGDNLYKKLPNIAKQIELANFNFDISNTTTEGKESSAENASNLQIIQIEPTTSKIVTFTYKNTGNETWTKGTWLYVVDNNNKNLYATSIFADKNYVAANLREDKVNPGFIGHFDVEINSGYEPGIYSLELVPIINGIKKFVKGTIVQPIEVKAASNSYTFMELIPPQKENYFGQNITAKMKLYNSGNTTWYRSGDMAITIKAYPLGRESLFIPKTNDNDPTILARLSEPTVPPGGVGTFEFVLKAPLRDGKFEEKFIPLIGKDVLLGDRSMQFNFDIIKPNYKAQLLRESTKNLFYVGEKKTIRLGLKNISDVPWEPEQVEFRVAKSGDLKFDLNSYTIADFVPVHQAGFANVTIQAPTKPGKYTAILQALANGKQFEKLGRFDLEIEVEKPGLSGQLTYQSADKIYVPKGGSDKITVRIKNKTSMAWYRNSKNKLALITKTINSPIKSSRWESDSVVALMKEEIVQPGNTATFDIYLQPRAEGKFKETFYLHVSGMGEVSGVKINIEVISGKSDLQYKKNNKTNNNKEDVQNNINMNNSGENIGTSKDNSGTISTKNEEGKNISLEDSLSSLKDRQILSKTKKDTSKVNAISNSSEQIRVKLSFPGNTVNILGKGAIAAYLDNKKLETKTNSNIWVKSNGAYKLVINIDGTKYYGKSFKASSLNNNSFVKLENWDRTTAWNRNYNDNFFRGSVEIMAKDNLENGKIDVINTLDFEDYMKGIAEVPETSSNEKRKALAVISRSYAVHYTTSKYRKFPGEYYDASDDPKVFQKYLGAGYELRSPKWQQALIDTKGEVVMYNGEVLRAAYFSCSNGKTKNPGDAGWGNNEYFVKVKDVYQSVDDELGKDMERYRKGQCGHGVGLSGLGAENMSQQGTSYKKILHYYYQGIDIGKR